ncbi:hypothetical protein M959_06406, partial [Chaetura pelagica]
ILILAPEVLAAHPSLVSAAILVSKLSFNYLDTNAKVIFFCLFSFGCNCRNVGNTFPRLLNSKVEQKEDTRGHTPFSLVFLAEEKK